VEFVTAATNADMLRAVAGGVELGTVGYQSPAVMADQGISNVRIVAGVQTGLANLVMRKGEELPSWKALEGKRIGQVPGSWVAVLFALAAEANGVDLQKVTLVNIPGQGASQLQALKGGDVDGIVTWSPTSDAAVVQGVGEYPNCCDIGSTKKYGAGNQLLAANTAFLADKTTAVNFLKAYAESMDFYANNSTKAVDLIVQYSSAPRDVITASVKQGHWTTHVDIEALKNVARAGSKFGFTKADQSAHVADLIDLKPLSEATGESVERLSAGN